MNGELELYKLCCTGDLVEEMGWISDTEFCVWVSYFCIQDFINGLQRIFGYGIFDDGGFDANMQVDGVCIDLCDAVGHCVDIKTVFPKDKYKH